MAPRGAPGSSPPTSTHSSSPGCPPLLTTPSVSSSSSQVFCGAGGVFVRMLSRVVASVLGNGGALLVYCRRRKKLRPPELMIINLALCDLGFSLLGGPFVIISSLCHAWVFGETGCLWYGIQGFVFGIGSLLTTCLISLDRCLKICCVRYGQWIERRHVTLSIVLVWLYTLFWALLPAFGFGGYGPEPYGTSCTVNWWSMRSSLYDRIYIFLILILCFGIPTLTIVASYLAILLKVHRSKRTLASIPSSSVTHTGKELKLTKIAAVVCTTFLLAWMPYAAVSLFSALVDQGASLQAAAAESTEMTSPRAPRAPKILDIPSLLNWTAAEYSTQIYYSPEKKWDNVNKMDSASVTGLSDATFSSTLHREVQPMSESPPPSSSLPPVVTLIPVLFAKSHCMINPIIYQIMNREFRNDIYALFFGQEKAKRRQMQGGKESCDRSISVSDGPSWKRRRSRVPVCAKKKEKSEEGEEPGE
ncbi:opsin 9 isoform 2-T2 [Spinachia spinachia]